MRFLKTMFVLIIGFLITTETYADDLTLSTTAFLDAGILPVLYTCDGKDISPQFAWSNAPSNTKSYALIFEDKEAPDGLFYHWIVYNIPSQTQELAEGTSTFPS